MAIVVFNSISEYLLTCSHTFSFSHLVNSMAGTQSATVTYIAEFHTSDKAVRAASFVNMFLPSVWIVLSTLSIILIPMDWVLWISSFPFKPWRLYLICVALINLWNAIVFSYLPESPKFLLAKNRKDEALDVLRRIYAFNTGSPKDVSWDLLVLCENCLKSLYFFFAFSYSPLVR